LWPRPAPAARTRPPPADGLAVGRGSAACGVAGPAARPGAADCENSAEGPPATQRPRRRRSSALANRREGGGCGARVDWLCPL